MKFVKISKSDIFSDTEEYKRFENEILGRYSQCFEKGIVTVGEFLDYMESLNSKYKIAELDFFKSKNK